MEGATDASQKLLVQASGLIHQASMEAPRAFYTPSQPRSPHHQAFTISGSDEEEAGEENSD
jgi:hypothetical protein